MTAGRFDPPEHVLPEVDLTLLRAGLARCRWCGGTRPVDCWCTCRPVDDQLAEAAGLLETINAAKAAAEAAPTPAELLRRIDVVAEQLAGLRAEVEAHLEADAFEASLAGQLTSLHATVVDLAAVVCQRIGQLTTRHGRPRWRR